MTHCNLHTEHGTSQNTRSYTFRKLRYTIALLSNCTDSSVGNAKGLSAGVLNQGTGKKFVSSLHLPPSALSSGYREIFPRGRS
jgi:hypothetical protein